MSNHHLKNIRISLRAKGLLSIMLSLPENWDYTLKGLARISLEGVDAIRMAIQELETEGYIVRSRVRNEKGQLTESEYVIYEKPVSNPPAQEEPVQEEPVQEEPVQEEPMQEEPMQVEPMQVEPMQEKPMLEKPMLENPIQAKPILGEPTLEKSMQLNINILNTKLLNTNISNPILSNPSTQQNSRDGNGLDRIAVRERYQSVILENLDYEILCQREDKERLDEIVELMLDTVCTSKNSVRIAGDDYPAEVVRSRLLKLSSEHIEYVFDAMKKNTTHVRNIRQYLLAALFNAPATIENYYSALVNNDLYGN